MGIEAITWLTVCPSLVKTLQISSYFMWPTFQTSPSLHHNWFSVWLNHNNSVSIYESICYSAHLVDVDRLASMMQCFRNSFEIFTEFNGSAFFSTQNDSQFDVTNDSYFAINFIAVFFFHFTAMIKAFVFCCCTRVLRDRNWFLRERESNWKIRLNCARV